MTQTSGYSMKKNLEVKKNYNQKVKKKEENMSTKRTYLFLALLLISVMTIMVPQHAFAAGTASGTTISNQATVNYQVGGISQTAINSATISFVVDNKVNVTVAQLGNATVVPGSTNQVLSFSVTNNGNTAQSYALSATNNTGITMNNVRIYRDVNANGTYEAGTDILYVDATTFGSIAADGVLRVLIVADTPAGATNGQTAVYNLIAATTNAGTTTATTQTAGADTPGVVDVVFADAAGSATGDTARDGKHSTTATYTVNAATLTVTKTSAVYSDPFNGTTSPKAIPGAIITYTVTIANAAGGANATGVTITDSLATEITANHLAFNAQFNDGVNTCAAAQGIAVDPNSGTYACKTNANDGDGADWNVSAANTVTVSGLSINAGQTARIKFQAVVQ
jgi:uncharacterized repeat protein (TIGR01451 family)